jgi:hypothetical protein
MTDEDLKQPTKILTATEEFKKSLAKSTPKDPQKHPKNSIEDILNPNETIAKDNMEESDTSDLLIREIKPMEIGISRPLKSYFPAYEQLFQHLQFTDKLMDLNNLSSESKIDDAIKTDDIITEKSKEKTSDEEIKGNITADIPSNKSKSIEKVSNVEVEIPEIKDAKTDFTSNFRYNSGKILIRSPKGHEIIQFLKDYTKMTGMKYFEINLIHLFQYPKVYLKNFYRKLFRFLNQREISVSNVQRIGNPKFLLVCSLDLHSSLLNSFPSILDSEGQLFSKDLVIAQIFESLSNFFPITAKGQFILISNNKIIFPQHYIADFDLEIQIDLPDQISRRNFFAAKLNDYFEMGSFIRDQADELNHLTLQMDGWSFADIQKWVNYLYHSNNWKEQKNPKSTTLIQSHCPDIDYMMESFENWQNQPISKQATKSDPSHRKTLNEKTQYLDLTSNITQGFEKQMYLDAASNHYEDISIILDKLSKGLILQPHDRKILADFSFLLKDEPQKALQKLNKAKIKIDKIMQIKKE